MKTMKTLIEEFPNYIQQYSLICGYHKCFMTIEHNFQCNQKTDKSIQTQIKIINDILFKMRIICLNKEEKIQGLKQRLKDFKRNKFQCKCDSQTICDMCFLKFQYKMQKEDIKETQQKKTQDFLFIIQKFYFDCENLQCLNKGLLKCICEEQHHQQNMQETSIQEINAKPIIKQISTKAFHVILLDNQGSIYTYGHNAYGQLGLGEDQEKEDTKQVNKVKYVDRATKVQLQKNDKKNIPFIIQISAGAYHSVILDDEGIFYSCGSNFQGQLGLGDYENRSEFHRNIFHKNEQISLVQAGYNSTIILDMSDNMYICGDENNGSQLGIKCNRKNEKCYFSILEFTQRQGNIKNIAMGYFHTVILDNIGNIYAYGYNEYGQLGLCDTECQNYVCQNSYYIQKPMKINTDMGFIMSISAGYFHTLVLNSIGQVYACGYNSSGQLFINDRKNRHCYTLLSEFDDTNIKQVYTGDIQSLLINDTGNIYYTGQENIDEMKDIKQAECGEKHVIFLDKNGNTYSFGDNMYGQLGK